VAIVLVMPAAMVAAAVLTGQDSALAGGGCGGDGGPGGGSRQLNNRRWDAEQMTNAQTITAVTMSRRLPQRAAVIALAAAAVESNLHNVTYGDRDSLGLFQERPSQGWGSPEQVLNPAYATNTFLDHLMAVPDWSTLPPGAAEQAVERSAYPDRYAPAEGPATTLMHQFWTGPDNRLPSSNSTSGPVALLGCTDQGGSNLATSPATLPPDYGLPTDPLEVAAVSYALAQVGKPYVWGAKGPGAFDCSGLMQAAWAHAGVPISAGTTSQVHDGTPVTGVDQAQPGDLLFIPGSLGTPANPQHVGMDIGDGLVVDAYDEHHGVIVEKIASWIPKIVAIRHIAGGAAPGRGAP
jgi:cell wall-associated NlpC family hydrolase